MSDLIEEWETVRQEDAMHYAGDPWWLIDQALIERTIKALSPTLPDEDYQAVKQKASELQEELNAEIKISNERWDRIEQLEAEEDALGRKMKTSATILQQRIKELEAIPRDEADGFNKIIAHYQQQAEDSAFDIEEVYKPQIESLQAQVKELEAKIKTAGDILAEHQTLTAPTYLFNAIAALAERNQDEP